MRIPYVVRSVLVSRLFVGCRVQRVWFTAGLRFGKGTIVQPKEPGDDSSVPGIDNVQPKPALICGFAVPDTNDAAGKRLVLDAYNADCPDHALTSEEFGVAVEVVFSLLKWDLEAKANRTQGDTIEPKIV